MTLPAELPSLYNLKYSNEDRIKELKKEINPVLEPEELGKPYESKLNEDQKKEKENQIRSLETENQKIEEKIKKIKKQNQEKRDEILRTEYKTEIHFKENMESSSDLLPKNMCLIGKSACETVQKYQQYIFIEFDLKNSMTSIDISNTLKETIDKKKIKNQPIALFRNAQLFKENIGTLVDTLGNDHQKHTNLYLFEENFDNMLTFKNKYVDVYYNRFIIESNVFLIHSETENEKECSITITEPPLKENNTFIKIIGFVIGFVILFGFYKVLREKVLRKKQKNGKNK